VRQYLGTVKYNPNEWVYVAQDQLKNTAASYWALFKRLQHWEQFSSRLQKKFDGPNSRAKLSVKLYSGKQKDNEMVEIFVARKTQIYGRIHYPATEIPALLIPLLITQLKEELWEHLVTISFNNIDKLIMRASNLEREFVTRPNSNQLANEKITQKNLNQ